MPESQRTRLVVATCVTSIAILALALTAWHLLGERHEASRDTGPSLADSLGGDTTGFARADRRRDFTFPADHGAHPDYRTEWWYFTGNLTAADGERRFGYQLTFFRSAVAPPGEPEGDDAESAWRTRQVWMAHLAVTDVEGNRFHAADRYARGALGLAGVETEPFRVHLNDWSARKSAGTSPKSAGTSENGEKDPVLESAGTFGGGEKDPVSESAGTFGDGEKRPDLESAGTFPWRLAATDAGFGIDLSLEAGKGAVLQGDGGLSRKGGEGADEASYYYSFPRMPTTGTLTVGGERFAVEGDSWFDREWSSALLAEGRVGWDWVSLQLDDGRELIAFRLRGEGGDAERGLDYAALVTVDGELRQLDAGAASLTTLGQWTSRETGVRYPSGWQLLLPDAGIDLDIQPWIDDQELDLTVRYWEGAVRAEGEAAGETVDGVGYVELTGYR